MKYLYCKECKEPIGARSTFHEAVVLGKAPQKKNKPVCGKSHNYYCLDCYIELRKKLGKTECDNPNCRKNNNGHCDLVLRK